MKLYALDIPDDAGQIAHWLERHVVGHDLAALVAELATVHGPAARRAVPIEQLLGDRLPEVRRSGLSVLTSQQLQQLLTHPLSLIELQADVLENGAAYWDQLLPADRTKAALDCKLPFVSDAANAQSPARSTASPTVRTSSISWRRSAFVALATAASVLAATFLWQANQPQPAGPWGWSNPSSLAAAPKPAAYLNQLADAAGDWFKKRPTDSAELAQRILQFRQGCSQLILADHRSLSAEDRKWLVERCRAWAGKFDAQVAALEAGDSPTTVRDQADETVNKLIAALRDRARQTAANERPA